MEPSLAAALKADFDRDGYVVVRDFFPNAQVEEICRRAEAVTRARPNAGGIFTNITKGLEKIDDYFGDLLRDGPHVPILEMLLGRKPEPTTASFFTKNKHSEEVHPHSDALEGGVVWVALDPASRDNGCLHFLKGSHLEEAEFAHLKAHEPTDLSDRSDVAEVAMEPGDIVFFRPTTVHWSGPNHDGSDRRGFNCFYVSKHAGRNDLSKKDRAALETSRGPAEKKRKAAA